MDDSTLSILNNDNNNNNNNNNFISVSSVFSTVALIVDTVINN